MFSATLESEGTIQQRPLMPAKLFASSPGLFKECDMPCSNVTMRALIEVEDISSTGWELSLDKQYELNCY
jgi:hypothetical protein